MKNDKKLNQTEAVASRPCPPVRSEARAERLAKALRANLHRRKAAGRELAGGREDIPGDRDDCDA